MLSLRTFVNDVIAFANPVMSVTERELKVNGFMTTLSSSQSLFVPPPTPQVSVASSSRASSKTSTGECGRCMYVIKKKTGESEVCGKNARNVIGDKWFCGTEKSGHYASERKKAGSAPQPVVFTSGTLPVSSVLPKKEAVTKSRNVLESTILARISGITQSSTNSAVKPTRVAGTDFFTLNPSRILIDHKSNQAYGVLDVNNRDIHPLTQENLAFLKANNIAVRGGLEDEEADSQPLEEADEDELEEEEPEEEVA